MRDRERDRPPGPDPGHPFAGLAALRASLAPARPDEAGYAADAAWIEDTIAAPHEHFTVDAERRIHAGERSVEYCAPCGCGRERRCRHHRMVRAVARSS